MILTETDVTALREIGEAHDRAHGCRDWRRLSVEQGCFVGRRCEIGTALTDAWWHARFALNVATLLDGIRAAVAGEVSGDAMTSCSCGESYSPAELAALPSPGVQHVPDDDSACDCDHDLSGLDHDLVCESRAYVLDLRNCACGSTMAIRLDSCSAPAPHSIAAPPGADADDARGAGFIPDSFGSLLGDRTVA